MDTDDFRTVEAELASGHAQMAGLLGVSEVSIKRYATGAQSIPEPIAKLALAMLLIEREGLQAKFTKLLRKYHTDTS